MKQLHYYQYSHNPSWIVESETPRPDLLAWAYWSEVEAPAKVADTKPEPAPGHDEHGHSAAAPSDAEPAAKPAPVKRARRTPKAQAGE